MGVLDSCSHRAVPPRLTATSLSRIRWTQTLPETLTVSAGQLCAAHLEPVEPAQQRNRNLVRVEKEVSHFHHLLAGNGFDLFHDLVYAEKVLEVHFLASQVRHPGHGALETKNDVALELVLGAPKLLFRESFELQAAKLAHDQLDHF